VEVAPRRDDLARLGLTVREVAETVELALEGEEVSRLVEGAFYYPIILRLEEKDRKDIHSIGNLLLRTPGSRLLAIRDVADVRLALTATNVSRENVSRRIVVAHNVEGRALGEVVADLERALDRVRAELPPGYAIRISGQFEAQEEATRVMGLLSILSLLVMGAVLVLHFRSPNLALQTLLSIPLAFIGAAAWVVLSGQNLSVATLVGLVALGGIATRNTILLRDHYLHLMREEKMPFGAEMIVRAGRQRIVPVLLTALTSGIALVPIVLTPGEPGRELLYPVATVIVGGLISSTLLDVLLTPAVFALFGRRAAEAHAARLDTQDALTERLAADFASDAV
jgi:Cu/Ag efflux pump CusA